MIDNTDRRRFELRAGPDPDADVLSFATYTVDGSNVVVPHVETRLEHRGNGYADELMAGLVKNLRATDRRIVPLCPFAAGHIRRHPETQDVLAER